MKLTKEDAANLLELFNIAVVSRGQIHVVQRFGGNATEACMQYDEDRAAFERRLAELTEG